MALAPMRANHGGRESLRPVCRSGTACASATSRWTPSGSPARSVSMPDLAASLSALRTNVTSPESHSVIRLASNER